MACFDFSKYVQKIDLPLMTENFLGLTCGQPKSNPNHFDTRSSCGSRVSTSPVLTPESNPGRVRTITDRIRTCAAANRFSILRMSVPSSSLSPDRRAPAFATSRASGGASVPHSPSSIGASAQNGDAGPSVLCGSSHASNPHLSVCRSGRLPRGRVRGYANSVDASQNAPHKHPCASISGGSLRPCPQDVSGFVWLPGSLEATASTGIHPVKTAA